MAISPQHRTMTCGQSNQGKFLSGSQHQDWIHLFPPEMLNKKFGMWTVVSREVQRRGKHQYAKVQCTCGHEDWKLLDNLKSGKSKMCRPCTMRKQHSRRGHLVVRDIYDKLLQRRAQEIFQRCTNPKNAGWKNYGGRGIRCEFSSIKALVEYLLSLHAAKNWEGYTIDRINNDGNYAVGNIRRATYKENNLNRRPRTSTILSMPDPDIVSRCRES